MLSANYQIINRSINKLIRVLLNKDHVNPCEEGVLLVAKREHPFGETLLY